MRNDNIPDTVWEFWEAADARGELLRPIYVVSHTAGSHRPEGSVETWTVDRRTALRLQDKCVGLTIITRLLGGGRPKKNKLV